MRRMSIATDNSLVNTSKPFAPTDLFLGDDSIKGAVYDVSAQNGQLYTTSTGEELCGNPGEGSEVSVGMILDGKNGYSLGPELLDPDYTTWTTHASVSLVDGKFTHDGVTTVGPGVGLAIATGITIEAGKSYLSTWRIDTVLSTGACMRVGGINSVATPIAVGTYTEVITAVSTEAFRINARGSAVVRTGQFSPLSCREIIGVPLVQPTSTKRPAWRARYNLLTYSEDFTNAIWSKIGMKALVVPSAVNGLTGYETIASTTAAPCSLYQTFASMTAGIYVAYCKVRAGTVSTMAFGYRDMTTATFIDSTAVILSGPGSVTGTSIHSVSGLSQTEWTEIKFTLNAPWTNGNSMRPWHYIKSSAGSTLVENDSNVFHSTSLQYVTSANSTIPIYQYIADALTYDNSSAFPRYLQGDGLDDFMYTPSNMDMSGTGVVSTVGGVTKLSDAAIQALWEHSATVAANPSFNILAPNSIGVNSYLLGACGTARSTRTYSTYTAPISNVVSGYYNSTHADSAEAVQAYIDGVLNAGVNSTSSASTGNFASHVLYAMSRAGTSLFFDGFFYSQIIYGGTLSEQNRKSCEQWVAQRMRLTI